MIKEDYTLNYNNVIPFIGLVGINLMLPFGKQLANILKFGRIQICFLFCLVYLLYDVIKMLLYKMKGN